MVHLTELLPPSPSSSFSTHDLHHPPNHRYDVFLSFRGVDTRNGFTDHLYNTLLDAGVITFLDDEEIETGEPLKPELEDAIKSSRASIIVLSKNYTSSTWCLDELVLILEQKRKFNQIIIPIFYHVEPTHVRKQQNSFGEAMEKHKRRMDAETDAEKRSQLAQKMESWKMALTKIADLKGKDAKGRKETEVINEVVTDIHHRLGVLLSNTLPRLIGMDYEIELIRSWLTDESCHSADILTIVGMGGIGKTSLAKYIFKLQSRKFHKSSFIEGIDARCKENLNGILDLQKQLCGDISKNIPLQVHDVSVYASKIKNALTNKKVLLVLDDVGSLDQLDALLGNEAFHQGSKIIITTKDASLTERCTLFDLPVQPNHRLISLNGLYKFESLELLCIHAFKSHKPKEGYKEVSEKLVKYCQGHPLALEVLGKSLHKRDVAYWEECIKVIKKEPHSRINKALKVSFDSLLFENDKELFKHIACFFVGADRDVTETILSACDINTSSGITNLIDKCLLSIRWNNKLMMHQLVQEMGRDLVRQESPGKSWKGSRLWCHEDSFKVLKQKKGKGNLLGLALDMRMIDKKKLYGSFKLETESLSQMDNLILLQLNYVQLNGCLDNFPKELRWLCMHGSSLKSIPLDLPMENLVVLDMSYSNIEDFGISYDIPHPPANTQKGFIGSSSNDKRLFGSLKILDLSFCQQLHTIGGFFELPALERLIVTHCIRLIEVCESVEQCVELVHIDLSYCYRLKKIPISLGKLKEIKTLLLDGCNFETESIPSNLKSSIIPLPSSFRLLSLVNRKLSNDCFPMDLSSLAMLKELYLDGNPVVSINFPWSKSLYLDDCHKILSIEYPPCTLRELSYDDNYNGSDYTIRKIKFYAEMSALKLTGVPVFVPSCEINGMVKIQGMASVEKKVLHSLGWKNLDFKKERPLELHAQGNLIECQTQMYYEFGIFSTFYKGKEMPEWISCRSKGSSISFTIPSSPNNLRGLNFCCVESSHFNYFSSPLIKISNITQNHTWIYKHCSDGEVYFEDNREHSEVEDFSKDGEENYEHAQDNFEDGEDNFEDGEENYENGEENYEDGEEHFKYGEEHLIDVKELDGRYCLSFLSHWMFGPNEMKAGDHIIITVATNGNFQQKRKCGIGLVYDSNGKNEEEENVLSYYKSWNHIIGGDLSPFRLLTGEYIMYNNFGFTRYDPKTGDHFFPFTDYGRMYKAEKKRSSFKAFSPKKRIILLQFVTRKYGQERKEFAVGKQRSKTEAT